MCGYLEFFTEDMSAVVAKNNFYRACAHIKRVAQVSLLEQFMPYVVEMDTDSDILVTGMITAWIRDHEQARGAPTPVFPKEILKLGVICKGGWRFGNSVYFDGAMVQFSSTGITGYISAGAQGNLLEESEEKRVKRSITKMSYYDRILNFHT